ncbi:MAG: DUF4179 domain-containing protein [Actinobacteria bacterium]|nr:DUF4179 domain-containing protein [Actinomycetota bacterium]
MSEIYTDEQIRKLLNKINEKGDVEVSPQFHKRVQDTLNSLPQRRSNRKRLAKVSALVASFLMISAIAIGSLNPTFATDIPVIGSVFKHLNNIQNSIYDDYAVGVGESQTSKGITVTVNDVAFDGKRVIVGYIIKFEKPFTFKDIPDGWEDKIFAWDELKLTIGRNRLKAYANTIYGQYTDSNTFMGVGKYDLIAPNPEDRTEDVTIPQQPIDAILKISMISDNRKSGLDSEIKGKWNFKFQLTKDNAIADVKVVEPKISVKTEFGEIKFNKVRISPFSTDIEYEAPQDPILGGYEYNDDRSYLSPGIWVVTDDTGKELKWEAEYGLGLKAPKNKEDIIPRVVKFTFANPGSKYINISSKLKSDKSPRFEVKIPLE